MSRKRTLPEPLSAEQVSRLIGETFPAVEIGRKILVETVAGGQARVRLKLDPSNLRPGGSLSGPAMFMLADFTIYVALIATLGPTAIEAATSNLNISFLLRPRPVDAYAEARIIRLGRRLAYAEVGLYSDGADDMIAHATGSYALPAAAHEVA